MRAKFKLACSSAFVRFHASICAFSLLQEMQSHVADLSYHANAQRSQKVREEKAKLECQQRLVQLELLLRKDLDAAGLSDLYRKLSVTSQVPLKTLTGGAL